jgi:hypothetical protein
MTFAVDDIARSATGRIATDCETAADDLVRLVLALVETLRQVVERQAIRRVEGGQLSDDQIERLGLTLLQLEQRMAELKSHYGLSDEDLTLRLGPLAELADV